METNQIGILLALGANICFALSSIYFTRFSRLLGSVWMNTFKAAIAFLAFSIFHFIIYPNYNFSLDPHYLYFLLSGFIGLGIGDIFLIKAFVDLGPAKTLVLFAFQPIIFILIDSTILGTPVSTSQIIAICIFITCVVLFSLENMTKNNSWKLYGLLYAVLGIFLDGTGIFLTKKGFIHFPEIQGMTANAVRCFGALSFFFIVNLFSPIKLRERFQSLPKSIRYQPILFSFTGTFLSLFLYLSAIKLSPISVITGITVTAPILSTVFESIIERKKPTKTHILVLFLFIIAFYISFNS